MSPSFKDDHIRRVGARLSGRWRASQQSRYGLLDGRLFCIFIHRHPWGECPLSVLNELGPVSLNRVDPGVADQIE